MTINYSKLPEHMQEGARRYIEDGIEPGGFLTAVLSNDLKGAYVRADEENLAAMREWVNWVYWECPGVAQGSSKNVKAWIDAKQETRTDA